MFTVLKSPHVNKTAQEQFEIRKYEKYIELYSYSNIFLFFIIKRISKMLCKDVRIEIGINFNNLKFVFMSEPTKKPIYISSSPSGEDQFEGKSHEKISNTIFELIKSKALPNNVIGIDHQFHT